MRRIGMLFLVVVLLLNSLFFDHAVVQAEPAAPADVPTALVASGVANYALVSPKLFWYTPVPQCPIPDASGAASPAVQYPETIKRIATYGSIVRTLYSVMRDCNQGQILSNLAADADYIYWLTAGGLVKLSTDANPGDAPQLVNALVSGVGEVAVASDRIYVLYANGPNTEIDYVWKSNSQRVFVALSATASDMQIDGQYVYYRTNSNNLVRVNPGVNSVTIATAVTGYYPEGQRLIGCTISPPQCFFSNNVYVAKSRSIYIYNNNNNTLGAAIYTSADTTAVVYGLTTDFSRLFFFERRTGSPCSPFCPTFTVVTRATRSGSSVAALYTSGSTLIGDLQHLTNDGTYIFWNDNGALQRLPGDATALPQVNMWVTGMEVTQSIQNLSNSVVLIKNKRTFVRVYVKSQTSAVSGVTAILEAPVLGLGPLSPVNPAGTTITVRPNPSRDDINQSFLFELPWTWTQQNSLNLRVTLNPYKVPLEPNYGDNLNSLTVNFVDSPTLSVEFFRLNYTINGVNYSPRINEDILRTYSWILRAYPLGGSAGQNFKPRLWDVAGGTQLGNWVRTTDPACALVYNKPKDDIALCASYYTNGWLYYYRVATMFGVLNIGLNPNAFYYGMISDASGNFPRGQAMYTKTSVGPAGTPGLHFNLGQGWDTDGTYADWYAAHEIGHSLGRSHPNAGSDDPATPNTSENCGHSRSDPSYPYGNTSTARAPIGPADGSMEGFDVGDAGLGIKPAVLPSSTWNDVMSYCNNQWISDYTYTGMYNYMLGHPSAPVQADVRAAALSGDFLILAGEIDPAAPAGGFAFVRRVNSVTGLPAVRVGDYSMRLLDASDGVLVMEPIITEQNDDLGRLGFGHVMNMAAGARKVQLIRTSDSLVLATQLISANPPQISNVALQGAPNPVTGVVTLGWTASDPDNDPLTYDVAYSRDNGQTFQPVAIGLTGLSAQIDTAQLGGSDTARFRVTASDGVNSAYADSATFNMANRPPVPSILTPENNLHIQYGQLVNFSGLALDPQDGTVADTGLLWTTGQGQFLGEGPLLSLDNLPVGTNVINLQAIDSVGQFASTSVTVVVGDDLNLPGPTLTAGPAQVSWQVPAGSTTPQTAVVSINNAGSGDLTWTAGENAAWLGLSAAGGTILAGGDPAALTLTANPSGLAEGKTYQTQLILTKPASGSVPAQTVIIPVNLSVGGVHDALPNQLIFLPILRR